MITSSLKKTAVAAAVAGTFAAAASPVEADVLNLSWTGAFTFLNPDGLPIKNGPTDWSSGYYAIAGTTHGPSTAFGWYGNRTPISGTMSFDTVTGAGAGTIVPFLFLGDATQHVMIALSTTFQKVADTTGTIIGTILFSWNGAARPVSIVLDGTGMFAGFPAMISSGPTSTISGVGALPASDGTDFDESNGVKTFSLGPSPIATKTTNTNAACVGVPITSQVNAFSIVTLPAFSTCFPTSSDTVGGSPFPSGALLGFNWNVDVRSMHLDSISAAPVPIPGTVWLFGSGLFGLIDLARRKRSD